MGWVEAEGKEEERPEPDYDAGAVIRGSGGKEIRALY